MPEAYFCQTLKRNYFSLSYEGNVSNLHTKAEQLAKEVQKTVDSINFRRINNSNHMQGFIVIYSTDGTEERPIDGAMQVENAWNHFH